MNILRGFAILLPQALIFLDIGARLDILFGFNRTDTGFTILLFLFALSPVVNLTWLITEAIVSLILPKLKNKPVSFLKPALALFFFLESLAVDVYLLSQAKM